MIAAAAYAWGRMVARYGRAVIGAHSTRIEGLDRLPQEPCVWAGWHKANFIALASYSTMVRRRAVVLAAKGLAGAGMAGWLDGLDIGRAEAVAGAGVVGPCRALIGHIRAGRDVLIAVDGPRGPALNARPGALWIAASSGASVCPVGVAASGAVRLPRWDRHIVPIRGSRVAVWIGQPFTPSRETCTDVAACKMLAERLHEADEMAARLLRRV